MSGSLIVRGLVEDTRYQPIVCLNFQGANLPMFRVPGVRLVDLSIGQARLDRAAAQRFRQRVALHARLYFLALRMLRRTRPDLVHINDDRTLLSFGLAARTLGLPVIWHVRQNFSSPLDAFLRRLATYTIFNANATAARFDHAPIEHARVIHNGTDLATFHPPEHRAAAKAALGIPTDAVAIGFVGRLTSEKRPEWVVRAARRLLPSHPNLHVVIVGSPLRPEYMDMLRETASGVREDRLHFLGLRHDVPSLMRAFDVLAVPSVAEPFGLVIIEAMASGTAVVGTGAGGVPEIIENGATGLLVDPQDFDAFVSALDLLVRDEKRRADLACAALSDVHERFSVTRVVASVIEVYDHVLAARSAASSR